MNERVTFWCSSAAYQSLKANLFLPYRICSPGKFTVLHGWTTTQRKTTLWGRGLFQREIWKNIQARVFGNKFA